MEESEELSDFDKGQVVVARELGMSASEAAAFVGCSQAAVVTIYRQWQEEGLRLRAGRSGLITPRVLSHGNESRGKQAVGAVSEEVPVITSPEKSSSEKQEPE